MIIAGRISRIFVFVSLIAALLLGTSLGTTLATTAFHTPTAVLADGTGGPRNCC
jgi:hypothetical protein